MKPQHVPVLDRVGDGVGVEPLLEEVLGRLHGGLLGLDLLRGGVFLEDGRAGETEELRPGEELFDGLVVLAELGAVALVEDEGDAFFAQRREQLLVGGLVVLFPLLVALARLVQREAELLDRRDDDLVGVVLGKEATHEGGGVGVLLDAAFLESVEFLAGLPVEILAVDDKEAFLDVGVVLQQGRGLERGEGLAAAGGVPDEAVAAVFVDAGDEVLHRIDLIRTHHQQLLLARDQHHVAADGGAKGAFHEEGRGEVIEVGDLLVRLVGELVDGQKSLLGIEGEVAGVVVREVVSAVAIADDEELQEAEECLRVAVAGVVLVIDDLLHGPARLDAEGLQLDLRDGHPIDEEEHVVAVVAVVSVDAELIDDLVGVFAPVADVDESVIQRRTVIAGEGIDLAQGLCRRVDIGRDDLVEEPGELGIGEMDPVQGLELFPEIRL